MAEERVPTKAEVDAIINFDPAVQHSEEALTRMQDNIYWLDPKLRDEYETTVAAEFNRKYGTRLTQDQLNWLFSAEEEQGLATLVATLGEVQAELATVVAEVQADEAAVAAEEAAVAAEEAASRRRSLSASKRRSGGSSASASPSRRSTVPIRKGAQRRAIGGSAGKKAKVAATKRRRVKSQGPPVVDDKDSSSRAKRLATHGIKEEALWAFKVPGSDYDRESPENITKTGKENDRDYAAAVVNDYVTLYKDPFTRKNVTKIPIVIEENTKIIKKLITTIRKFDRAFARYGDNVTIGVQPEDREGLISANADAIKYLEFVLAQRLKIVDYYLRAMRTRRPPLSKPTFEAFKASNTRVLLTPEAVTWVKAESFVIPEDLAVEYKDQDYVDLWEYVKARTGVAKEQTFAWKGQVTIGNYQYLLRIPLVKIPPPQKPEVKKGEKKPEAGPRRNAKYEYTKAMLANFKNKPATLTTSLNRETKKQEKIENTTGKSIIDLLADASKASRDKEIAAGADPKRTAEAFSKTELINTGILSLRSATHYSNDEAVAKNRAFYGGKYSDREHRAFKEESLAITDFYNGYKENVRLAEVDAKEKAKATKKKQGRSRR